MLVSIAAWVTGTTDTHPDLGGDVLAVVVPVYSVVGIALRGTTLGKRLLGVTVTDAATGATIGLVAALKREFVLVGFAYLVVLTVWRRSNGYRGWHDAVASSAVLRTRAVTARPAPPSRP